MKIIAHHGVTGQHAVYWYKKSRHIHRVEYGADIIETRDGLEAAREFGERVHHQIECAGRMDHNGES